MTLSFKTSMMSLVILMVLMVPATYVHEFGHEAVCKAYGYESVTQIDLLSATSYCYSESINYIYYAFGGVLAFLVFMAPIILTTVRKTPWVWIPLVVLAISHGINSIIETFAYDYYINDNTVLPLVLLMFSIVLFFGLLIKYGANIHKTGHL